MCSHCRATAVVKQEPLDHEYEEVLKKDTEHKKYDATTKSRKMFTASSATRVIKQEPLE